MLSFLYKVAELQLVNQPFSCLVTSVFNVNMINENSVSIRE